MYVQSLSSPQEVLLAGQYSLVVSADDNRLKLQVGTDSTYILRGATVPVSEWVHVFLSVSLSQAQLLVYFKSSDSKELSSQGLFTGQYQQPTSVTVGLQQFSGRLK